MAERLRALVASEQPELRRFLIEALEREPEVVVVGQADNAVKAMGLARSLRPEVVLVDFRLPHTVGFDSIPLSRSSGLDAAMDISEELVKSRVLLVTDAQDSFQQDSPFGKDLEGFLYRRTAAAVQPIGLHELYAKGTQANSLVFTSLGVRERVTESSDSARLISVSEKSMAYCGVVILGGLCLMATVMLAPAGVFVAGAGAAGLLLGAAVRASGGLWFKWRRSKLTNNVERPEGPKAVRDDSKARPERMLDI